MLGAGIRLGEALVGRNSEVAPQPEPDGKLAARIGALEERLSHLEVATAEPAMEPQTADVEAIRSQLETGRERLDALNEVGLRLRGELQGWLEDNVTARMADVESKLRAESERNQKQMLDAFVESVQTRVMHRISRLEEEVAGQSTAMTELRECSLRTEQSMQKLLVGIDRLVVSQQPASPAGPEETSAEAAPASPAVAEPADEPGTSQEPAPVEAPGRHRRWSIFG